MMPVGSGKTFLGLPNNPNYTLGPLLGSACDTMSVAVAEPEVPGDIRLYPNPNNGQFTLTYDMGVMEVDEIQVRDVFGRVVWQVKLIDQTGRMEIDLSRVPDGPYLVEMRKQSTTLATRRVMIQK